MKPAWDQLGDAFRGSSEVLIGDVDCTVEVLLCEQYGVTGYPTIKYLTDSTPPKGEDYEGGREFDQLKAFADENLKASCGPQNTHLCDEAQTAILRKYMAMTASERKKILADNEKEIAAAEEKFKAGAAELQETYAKLQAAKDAAVKAVNTRELSLLKGIKPA